MLVLIFWDSFSPLEHHQKAKRFGAVSNIAHSLRFFAAPILPVRIERLGDIKNRDGKPPIFVTLFERPSAGTLWALASVRTDDLAAVPIKALMERNPKMDWNALDDVVYGCANQAGEDNRNIGRMASLLSGLPVEVPGSTVNRLCGSSMDAVATAARIIKSGEGELIIAGGVESMSRAPFVMGKADAWLLSRATKLEDTTIGWRFHQLPS